MRTFDFAPLYPSTVGFDRMFSMLDQLGGVEGAVASYPPYNIERTGQDAYRVLVAVAGFTDADLSIDAKENKLTIRGEKQASNGEKTGDLLHWGIATRSFEA
jgi:molecular chaperone IbpA